MTAINRFTCSSNDLTTGVSPNCDPQIGATEKLIFTNESFEITDVATGQLEATWLAGIEAGTVHPLPLIEEFSNESEEDTYYTSPVTSLQAFIREGKQGFKYMIKFVPGLHARLRTGLNGKRMRLFMVDASNNVIGTSPDGTKVKGWVSGTLRVEKWQQSDGSNLSFTVIKFIAESSIETNDQVAVFPVSFNIKGLNGVQPASLELVGTPIATSVVVDVVGAEDGVAIEGITLPADFTFTKASDGSAQTIATVTESGTVPGRYTLAGTGLVTGLLNLNGIVTVGTDYFKGTAVTVTI